MSSAGVEQENCNQRSLSLMAGSGPSLYLPVGLSVGEACLSAPEMCQGSSGRAAPAFGLGSGTRESAAGMSDWPEQEEDGGKNTVCNMCMERFMQKVRTAHPMLSRETQRERESEREREKEEEENNATQGAFRTEKLSLTMLWQLSLLARVYSHPRCPDRRKDTGACRTEEG